MTRLLESDVYPITGKLKKYDGVIKNQTGKSLLELGFEASGRKGNLEPHQVGVVPVTTGIGLISGFSGTVAAIIQYLGPQAFVTEGTDVAGVEEAFGKGADILFFADDLTFAAINVKKGLCSDNGDATGRGFAAALKEAGGGREDGVLVLGAGPVGTAAAAYFIKNGISVQVYDKNLSKMDRLLEKIPEAKAASEWQNQAWSAIFDATTSSHFIHENNVTEKTWIAAPGMPLGVAEGAMKKCAGVIHNPLELGTAVMLCDVL